MLNDDEFIKTCDVPGPTKEEIRAILLYKSNVCHEDILHNRQDPTFEINVVGKFILIV